MSRSLDPKKIKSAQRVLEVLEYFNADRQEATVMDIARTMGYPQSSTSELLGCLVALGYLHRDRYARTYRPTARVPLLGAWVQPKLFRRGHLLPMMDELAEQSSMAVVLAARVGLSIQYIHVVGAGPEIAEGATVPLLHAALGKLLMATYEPDQVRKLAHRLNAETEDPALRVPFPVLSEELDSLRAIRHVAGPNEFGGATLGILLPRTSAGASPEERLALGLCGPAETIAQDEERLVKLMRAAVQKHLRPLRVVSAHAQADAPHPALPMERRLPAEDHRRLAG